MNGRGKQVEESWHTYEGVMSQISTTGVPVCMIQGGEDAWDALSSRFLSKALNYRLLSQKSHLL